MQTNLIHFCNLTSFQISFFLKMILKEKFIIGLLLPLAALRMHLDEMITHAKTFFSSYQFKTVVGTGNGASRT